MQFALKVVSGGGGGGGEWGWGGGGWERFEMLSPSALTCRTTCLFLEGKNTLVGVGGSSEWEGEESRKGSEDGRGGATTFNYLLLPFTQQPR